jgi:hypothetical protein
MLKTGVNTHLSLPSSTSPSLRVALAVSLHPIRSIIVLSLTHGSAEIEIADKQGNVYVAPDPIFHNIADHQYLPPREFIVAVYD